MNNTMGAAGCFPAGEKTTPAPAEGDAASGDDDIEWPDIDDMAHSAAQEIYAFGVSHDAIKRQLHSVMVKTASAFRAAVIAKQEDAPPNVQPKGTAAEPQRYSPTGNGGDMEIDSLGAWVKYLPGMAAQAPAPAHPTDDDLFAILHQQQPRITEDRLDYLMDPRDMIAFARAVIADTQAPAVGAELMTPAQIMSAVIKHGSYWPTGMNVDDLKHVLRALGRMRAAEVNVPVQGSQP